MRSLKLLLPLLASTLCFAQPADRITGHIDSSQMIRLPGHADPRALPQYDQGSIEPSFQFGYVTMLFTPSAAQSKALDEFLAEQQDPASPNYHKWLTPEQFRARFGMTANDMEKVTGWLKSQGFRIVRVARGGQFVVFAGTAAQIGNAFQMEIHSYNIEGETHFAPATMPSIPAALSGIVGGFRGLNDFRLKPGLKRHPAYTVNGASTHFLAPGDLYTIYNIAALHSIGIDGTGQSIAILGQTDLILTDIDLYRSNFGLPAINLQQVLVPNTGDPGVGVSGDLAESDLDLQVSGAVAPNATIIFVYAGFTGGGEGVGSSTLYAIDNVVAPVISVSYGNCEFYSGNPETGSLATQDLVYKQAASEGISFFNSSGDYGPATCDVNDTEEHVTSAVLGLAVDYPSSSAYVTSVGGTEFNEGSGTYWSSTNGTFGGSALSNIPEKSWNDFQELGFLDGGGGGKSNCFTQTSDFSECVSGNPKPSWQAAPGVPADGVRDVPDVSLSASNFNDPYVVCTPLEVLNYPDDAGDTTSSCASGITDAIEKNSAFGGTSASSPLMAGITVLLNQYLAGPSSAGLGNINPMLYSLASTPATYASAFNDTPSGSNSFVDCTKGTPTGQPAALQCPSTGTGAGTFGFDTTTGYDVVTGLGSVNADNLALAWAATRSNTTTSIVANHASVETGTSVTFTATVTPATAGGVVSFYNNGSTTALGTATLASGTAAFSTTTLPGGSNSVVATYNGNGTNNSSTSATPAVVNVTVPFTLIPSPATLSVPAGQTATSTITVTPVGGFTGTVNFTNSTASNPGSCTVNLPAGALCGFSPGSVTLNGTASQTVTLTITTVANMALPSGAQAITVTGTSGTSAVSATVNLTVTATNQSFALTTTAATFPVTVGGTAPVNLTVTGTGTPISFVASNTTALPLTYTCSGTPSLTTAEISCQWSPSNGQSVTAAGVTLSLVTTAPTTGQLRPPLERGTRIFYAMLLPGLFGIVFAAGSRNRGLRLLSLIMVLGFSTLWLGSCGGSGGGGTKTVTNPGTPAGSYVVTINATTGGTNPVPLTNNGSPLTITLNVSQ
jgi:subtilase family serine protease